MKKITVSFAKALAITASLAGGAALADLSGDQVAKLPPASDRKVSYDRDVRPILEAKCFECHGPKVQKSRLRLDSREAILRGGKQGPAAVPSNIASSRLLAAVAGMVPDEDEVMPPEGENLTPQQIGTLRAWIEQGMSYENPPATRP